MKVQLSFEVLLYVSLAALSTAIVLGPVAKNAAGIGREMSKFEVSQAVGAINSALMSEGSESLQIFIPSSLCNSTLSGGALTAGGDIFYFVKPVRIASGAFCPGGAVVLLRVTSNVTGGFVEGA